MRSKVARNNYFATLTKVQFRILTYYVVITLVGPAKVTTVFQEIEADIKILLETKTK
jgi:hypothetical protein